MVDCGHGVCCEWWRNSRQFHHRRCAEQSQHHQVNTSTTGAQSLPAVAVLNSDGFAIAWNDESGSGDDTSELAVRAQLYSVASANCYLVGSLVFTVAGAVLKT